MSNSTNYAYYPFPTTPTRSSAGSRSGTTSRESSPQVSYSRQTPQQPPRTPTRSGKMAPSPAAGRQQQQQAQSQASSNAPKTPTKLQPKKPQGNNTPGSATPQKLNQSASGKGAPNTPRSVSTKKPAIGNTPSSNSASKPKNAAQGAASTPKGAAQGKAEETAARGQQAADDATSQAQSTVGEDDDDDEPMSKVTQATEQGKQGLEQAAPEPIKDDEDENEQGEAQGKQEEKDATAGAKNDEEDEDEDEEDVADDATEKAGQMGESADDATTEENDGQQDEQSQQQGLLKGAQGLAGKASGLAGKGAGKAQESAGNASGKVQDAAGSATGKAQGAGQKAQGAAGKATDNAQKATQDPTGAAKDTANDAKKVAEDAADDTQATAQEGLDEAQKVAGEATDEAGDAAQDTADDVQEGVEDVKQSVEDTADDAQDTAQDAAEGAQDTAEAAKDTAEDAAEDAQDTAEEATDGIKPPEGLPLDLSILKGLEVQSDGSIVDSEGNTVGRLVEGDAEDLEGYPIGDDGEILDDDGDLVGRVELAPDQIKQQIQDAKEQGVDLPEGADEYLDQLEGTAEEATGPALPDLNIMEGLTCGIDGLIYDSEGNTIGRVTDGDADQLQHATLNDQGEFLDEDGNVVGYADIHEEAADLVEQGVYPAAQQAADEAQDQVEEAGDQAQDQVEGAADQAEDAADRAEDAADNAQEQAQGIEDQLPGIEALQGKELNETGDIVDDEGDVLGHIEDGDLKQKIADGEIDPNTLKIDEQGQVVDEDGNVLGQTELAEGAAEKLAGGPLLDPRILEGKKINKKGKILDEDGEEIGELRDGDLKDCAGLKVNDRGEILNKKGKIVGHASVVQGEAAENATRELLEELGELQPQTWPDLSILEGFKVNKKGQVLNEDGEPIGELIEGELSQCAGKKCNDQGEVLDKEGNVLGRVQNIPQHEEEGEEEEQQEEQPEEEQAEQEEQPEEGEEQAEAGEEEEEGDQLPPLSNLEGLTVNKSGKLIDSNGTVVGELVEGDAKKLSKAGTTCDAEGQFWDNKGHVIGRAQTVPVEDPDEEAIFAGLDGLHVVENGYVQDENGNTVGYVTEGDAKRLIGRVVDEDGDILDKKGSVVGHADRYDEPEVAEEQAEEADLSFLQGKTVNKAGVVIGDDGVPIARLIEGKPKELAGKQLDAQGQLWNNQGQVIGRVELIPEEEREGKAEGPFGGLEGLRVIEGGKIADDDGNVVGEIVEGNAKRLIGLSVDEDGDVLDKYGNVKGHAEPLPEEEEPAEVDNSILNGKQLNKQGYVVNEEGVPFGRLVEGNVSELAGRRCDENGYLYNDTGKVVGRCEVIPENERVSRPEGPFAGLEGLRVVKDGKVEDEDGNVVGEITEGNAKRLVGMAVDEDGDILDKYGNVKGHAEPYEEPEQEEEQPEDLSALAGCTINKSGNAVDGNGTIIGRVSEGDLKTMIGKKVDSQGQIWDNAGNVVGRCALVHGEDTSPEGPFAGFEGLQIKKDGTIVTAGDDIVGRVIEGDIKKLLGHTVDEDGDITDKNGNTIGKTERWEPEEKERRVNPMSGMRVNKEGEVRDDNGDLVGRLTQGDLGHCVGQEIDDTGNVVDVDGNKIGEVTLLENIAEDEYEGPSEEELEEARKREQEREIAEKMSGICTQTLERMQPICKQIKDHMEKADRTPKDELDEEELVNQVKPLIEEGGRILQECNGSLRGLDPDGKIAAQAKGRAGTGEATPEEYRLAETLKELTTTVVTTIDDAKKKLNDMPHAKKKLNPLWGLLTQPLFQILAAVGLLLAGVLGLVGQLLNALGLGGLVNGLLGGLGIDKLMSSLGFGGNDKKKGKGEKGGNPLGSLPIVGGFLGGDKK